MADLYIIDGYNLMHALEPGAVTAANLENKRRSLIEQVVNVAAAGGAEAVVVFDSSSARKETASQVPGAPVSIRFASRKESADIVIGKLVQEALKKTGKGGGREYERIVVVSADWEVQRGSMHGRASRLPPRHFIAELKKIEKRVALSSEMDRMHWKIEDKVDVETLKKLERMRRGQR